MATQFQPLTEDAVVNLTTTLSLTDGVDYILQPIGSHAVYLTELAAAPSVGAPAHVILPLQIWHITPESGTSIYVWGGVGVVVTEG